MWRFLCCSMGPWKLLLAARIRCRHTHLLRAASSHQPFPMALASCSSPRSTTMAAGSRGRQLDSATSPVSGRCFSSRTRPRSGFDRGSTEVQPRLEPEHVRVCVGRFERRTCRRGRATNRSRRIERMLRVEKPRWIGNERRRMRMRRVMERSKPRERMGGRIRSQETPCCAPETVDSDEYFDTILLQGFHWTSHRHEWYKILKEKAEEIAEAGYTHVWLPPPSHSVSPEGYLPGHLYELNTKYGSKQELLDAIAALKKCGIKVVADIVINHRCAQMQDENGEWNTYTDDIDHEGNKVDWGKWAVVEGDFGGTGSKDSGEDFHAAPDLDHENPELRNALVSWLCFLKGQVGFSGWRFDFVKGYAARFVEEYIVKTVGKGNFCVGEYWNDSVYDESGLAYNQDAARQQLCDWIDECNASSAAFDYTTKGILQEAVRDQYWRLKDPKGKATGLIGWWPDRAVTFIDNHDTGGEQNQWPFPSEKVTLGYVYVLTHPGIPSVFWRHHFDWDLAQDLKKLIALRRRNGINSNSKLQITMADPDCYVAEIGESVLVKLGSRFDLGKGFPGAQWRLVTSGKDYAVWEKEEEAS